jgi:hypothetical protein
MPHTVESGHLVKSELVSELDDTVGGRTSHAQPNPDGSVAGSGHSQGGLRGGRAARAASEPEPLISTQHAATHFPDAFVGALPTTEPPRQSVALQECESRNRSTAGGASTGRQRLRTILGVPL